MTPIAAAIATFIEKSSGIGLEAGLELNQAWKTMHGFCVATPPPGGPQDYGRRP